MKRETLIYALPAGEARDYMEELISTQCNTGDDIARVKAAASAAGYHSFRIAYFNGEKPNFAKAINV
jgi:hypothetical protein